MKQVSAFWWWQQSNVLLYSGIPLAKFERPFRSFQVLENTAEELIMGEKNEDL